MPTNVEIVRRGFEAFADNDFEGWFAIASSEIELYPRLEEPGVKRCYRGWDELLEYLTNWYSGWNDYTVEPERIIDAVEYVLVDAKEIGVAERGGLQVEQNFAHAFKLQDGKIVEWRMFGAIAEALEALGLEI